MQRQRLSGDALLAFIRQNPDADRDTLALDAGYFVMRHGKRSVRRSEFLEAIGAAHGTPVGQTIPRKGRKGKPPTYKIRVSPKGIAPIGPCYTKQIGVQPGQCVLVTVEDGGIFLEPEIANENPAAAGASVEAA